MAEVHTVPDLKGGQTYKFTTQVDGQPKEVQFTVPSGQRELVLYSADPVVSRPWDNGAGAWNYLELVYWVVALGAITGFAVAILWKFAKNTINLKDIISEADGKASLSRFQALLFTFVFVVALALIVVRTGRFPDEVPLGVWALLAGSLGTYLISKGMQLGMGGAGTAVPAFQPGGPSLRYGDNIERLLNMDATQAAEKRLQTGGESRFLVPAGNNVYGAPFVVATAAGKLKLSILAQPSRGDDVKGQVKYRASTGSEETKDLSGATIIETDPNSISEVRVELNAGAPDITVPVVVRTIA